MAKVVKTVGLIVAGAGLIIATGGLAAGFSLGAVLGASSGVLGLSIGSVIAGGLAISAIGSSLSHPKIPSSQTSRLTASIDPGAFRKTVLGQTAMATDVRYEEWSGDNQDYCDWIVAVASHAIDGVEEIWLNTDLAWSATTGVAAKYAGYFWVPNIVLEGTPANAFSFGSGKWSASSARLTGCAYVRLRFKVTGNGKKSDSPFSGGPPSRMTIIGRGAKLYDPRRDDTVPGGSGPMRWDDQSTWRYTTDDGVTIGENLPLQILYRVLGWRIRNPNTGEFKLAVGNGVPGRRIGMESFQVAANLADELVNRSAGGQEPRYHGAGVVSEGDDNKTVLDALCAGCCGRFRDTGGKLELVIAHNDLATAATDDGLNDDDVIGPFTWDPDPSLDETPNVVRGKYVDATAASLYQPLDYPEVRLPSPDGQDRFFSLDLGYVESPSQVQRIGKQVLERKQYQRRFTAPFDIRAWKYPVGAVVPFTFAALSFNRKLFRVEEQELGQNGTCNMTLLVESDQIYAWDADDTPPVQPADAIVYDARNNPLILAIDEASTTANWSAVVDDDGTKPENATVGAPPGTTVGGRTVEEVLGDIDTAKTDISELFDTYGDTANAAASANAADQAMQDAQAARDAASDAQTAAEASAQTASQHATDAAGSATTASGQATVATQNADAASQSATIASAAADTASTKAGEASVSASHAATSESNALGSSNSAAASSTVSATNANAAALAVAAAFPKDFAAGTQFWGNLPGSPQAQTQPSNWTWTDQGALGRALTVTSPTQYQQCRTRNLISTQNAGRSYRMTAKLRLRTPPANGTAVTAILRFYMLQADYSTIVYDTPISYYAGGTVSLNLPTDGSVQTLTVSGVMASGLSPPWIAPSLYLQAGDGSTMLGAAVDILAHYVEDVTESTSAAGSASAAAASASAASTSKDQAGQSASAANQSKLDAQAANTNAQGASSSAASSASAAAVSNSAAGQSASAANQAKLDAQAANGTAQAAASTASSQASIATAKAAEASSSSTQAASYAVAALMVENNQFFDQGAAGWAGSATAADAQQINPNAVTYTSYQGASNVLGRVGRLDNFSFKKFPLVAGHRYRLKSRFFISGNPGAAAGGGVRQYMGIQTYDSSGNPVGSNSGYAYYLVVGAIYSTTGWREVEAEFNADDVTAGATSFRLIAWLNYNNDGGTGTWLDYFTVDDITDSYSAETQAAIAASQAAVATSQAAAASQSAILSAQAGSGDSNLNSMFANWTDSSAWPAYWGPSSAVAPGSNLSRTVGITSPYAARVTAAANSQTYFVQTGSNAPWAANPGDWVVLEADIKLNSGSLVGAGVLMRVNGSGDTTLSFASDAPSGGSPVGTGVAGTTYSFRKLVQIPAGTYANSMIYCMNHWSVLGSIAAVNDITWYRCGWRPATAAEIKTGQIDTLNATVSQQAGAIANLQTKTATAYVETTASVPGAEATVEIVATTSNGSPASAIALKADAVVLGNQRALEVVGTEVRINGSMVNAAADGSKTTSNGWGLRQDDPSGNWVIGIGNLTKLGVA